MTNKNLSPAKRALLEKWLQGQSNGHLTSIPRRPVESQSLISFPQRHQLFLEFFNRGTAVNNLPVFLELNGSLNVSALEQSVNKILARHDVLRTRFCFDKGIPVPEILPDLHITIPIEDLHEFNGTEQKTAARQHAEREVRRPFDLVAAPLIRLKLYALSDEKHLLLVVVHHTISDGWSLGVFLKELMVFYQEIADKKFNTLTQLSIQYSDYVHWQKGEKLEAALQSSMPFWRKQLGGELPVLELPTDQQRRVRHSLSGGTHRFIISRDITDALKKIGRESDATLFMVLLTAYFILLHRYSGQDEIIVGCPIANRNHPDVENMIGVFINTLALRANLSTNPAFRETLWQVRDVCLEAYAHQDLPFEKIVEELKPHRDLNRTPIFQTVFNLQNSPVPKLEVPGMEIGFVDIDHGTSEFDLTLMISKLHGQCHATVEYSDELFKAATVARMFQSYQIMLEDIINHPDQPVSRLQLISKREHHHLVCKLNQTELEFPREKCFHELFEAQAERTPAAIAIVGDYHSLTYLDLNQRANNLARHLKTLGVRPGTRVGILIERCPEIAEALLGILKAGGIYVPIHTSFPPQRIQFILNDANVKVLITNKDHESLDQSIHVVNVSDIKLLTCDGSNLQTEINCSHPAYIIYTSGSTGNPKGVVVRHSSLINFLWSMSQRPGIKSDDVLLAITPISFDIAALELFLPLIVGATVVIANKETTSNPTMLGEAIRRYKVTMMQATPATWQLLIVTGWNGEPGLKVLCGGEALTRKLADQLLDRVSILWNMYGPTETTVWSSVAQIHKGDDPITIGQPIGNTQLYVLDRDLQITPAGVVGELHIGGEGLADGYLNRHLLTNEQFIPDPFSSKPGSRLYRTGDRARYLDNDSIEILGRMDDQVKINGHRIELHEITAILLDHPSLQEGIVITRTEVSGEKKLVAYIVQKPDSLIDVTELREFLGKKLPAYMIPAFFVSLDFLPLTTNGKIDRKALPMPENIALVPGYMAPRNEEEKILAEIWQNVLQMERVGIHDNFFDLGGASMQSLQVISKANMYGLPLTVENIFEHQTIVELANHINVNHDKG